MSITSIGDVHALATFSPHHQPDDWSVVNLRKVLGQGYSGRPVISSWSAFLLCKQFQFPKVMDHLDLVQNDEELVLLCKKFI